MKRILTLFATGFGLGYSPIASGTTGSLPGVAIVFAMTGLGLRWQIVISAVLAAAAFPLCDMAEDYFGKKDDGRIVADEYLTFPICMLGLPWIEHMWLLPVAFVVARLMDIIKPPPARQAQNLRGGLGIALDDLVASLYALAANHGIWLLYVRFGQGLG